jgi:hypothetical protein
VKKNEQPELSAKWWAGSQPKGLKSADKLENALKSYEGARKKLESSGEEDVGKAARDALGAVDACETTPPATCREHQRPQTFSAPRSCVTACRHPARSSSPLRGCGRSSRTPTARRRGPAAAKNIAKNDQTSPADSSNVAGSNAHALLTPVALMGAAVVASLAILRTSGCAPLGLRGTIRL